MADKKRKLVVEILGENGSLARAIDEADGKLDGFANKMEALGGKLRSLGTSLTLGVTLPIAAVGGVAFKMAADLQDAMGATDQIYKGAADSVKAWAEKLPAYYGIAQGEALSYANIMGSLLQNLGGLTEEQAAVQSAALTQLAGDLAAMYGGSTEQAVNAMTSALKGNTEMLDNYGISVTAASLKQRAMEMGISSGNEVLTDQQKQAAMLSIIWEQTGAAQGQAAREAGGASGQLRTLTTEAKNLATDLGTKLLPIGIKVLEFVRGLMDRFTSLSPTMQNVILIVAGLAAALGPVIYLVGVLATVIGFVATPVGAVVAVIAALVAAFVYFYKTNEGFREWVNGIVSSVRDGLGRAFEWLRDTVLPAVIEAFQRIAEKVGPMLSEAFAWISDVALPKLVEAFEWLSVRVAPVVQALGEFIAAYFQRNVETILWAADAISTAVHAIAAVFEWLWPVIQRVWQTIAEQVDAAIRIISEVIRFVTAVIKGDWSGAWDAIKGIASAVWDGLVSIVRLGGDAIYALVSWVIGAIPGVFSAAWNAVTSALGSAWNLIYQGVKWQIDNLVGFVWGLPGRIFDMFKGAGSWLIDAGKSIMRGLLEGLKDAWRAVADWVGSVGGKIADLKGPLEYDAKLLIPAGQKIMDGLGVGLRDGFKDVSKLVGGMAPDISAAVGAGPLSGASGGGSVQVIIQGSILHDMVGPVIDAVERGVRQGHQMPHLKALVGPS